MKESRLDQLYTLRLDIDLRKDLRKLAYLTEKPMSELIRDGIILLINENKKVLTNTDIKL